MIILLIVWASKKKKKMTVRIYCINSMALHVVIMGADGKIIKSVTTSWSRLICLPRVFAAVQSVVFWLG